MGSTASLATPQTGAGPGTRAVRRRIEPGTLSLCTRCGERVKFVARENRLQVIANVYADGRWDRVEHFHADCYELQGSPYGQPSDPAPRAVSRTGTSAA